MTLLLAGCVAWLRPDLQQDIVKIEPGNYVLDKDHASLLFKVDHMGLSTFVGRFNRFEASLNFDPDNIHASQLEATVDMTSVDVNSEKFARALRGRFWLNTEAFPQAHFSTSKVQRLGPQQLRFQGDLTFLGVSQPIWLEVKANGAGHNLVSGRYTMGFSASVQFSRSAFGLDRFVPTIGDEVELEIHAEFQRRE